MNDNAKNALLIYREKVANGEIEPTERKSLEQQFAEHPTRKLAIDLFCKQCQGGEHCSNWKQEIRKCQAKKCPLYQYRPYH